MLLRIRGSSASLCAALWLSFVLFTGRARADEAYGAESSGPILSLADTRRLALDRQPSLLAQSAAVDAAKASAIAAAQLPDPKLRGGVTDLTITGHDIGTLTRESDTQFNIGIAQEFPRGDTLRLRGQRASAEAELAERQLLVQRLVLEREVGLAWIEVWRPQRALSLARASEREAGLQLEAAKIAYANGKIAQADVRAATVTLELMRDDIAKLEQDTAHARAGLSRWIGDAAYRPMPEHLPQWQEPAPLNELLQTLRVHPHVSIAAKEVDVAEAGVALAKQAYKPDWSIELGYAIRPNYADYVNLQVGIDLPVFTANRQDRQLLARRAELERAEQLKEDDYREHASEARLNLGDWNLLAGRLARFDETILPEAQARIDAARLAWSSGSGTLTAVLDARRAALDAQLRRLDLESDRAKHALALRYLGATTEGEEP